MILITHYMEEVVDADKIYVMDHGRVVMEGTPRGGFSRVEELKKIPSGRAPGDNPGG